MENWKQNISLHKGINNKKVFMEKRLKSKNCDSVRIFHKFNKPVIVGLILKPWFCNCKERQEWRSCNKGSESSPNTIQVSVCMCAWWITSTEEGGLKAKVAVRADYNFLIQRLLIFCLKSGGHPLMSVPTTVWEARVSNFSIQPTDIGTKLWWEKMRGITKDDLEKERIQEIPEAAAKADFFLFFFFNKK